MDTRLNKLKADPRIEYIAGISGDRHIIKINLRDIHVHPKLAKIRGAQPKSIAILKSSIKDLSDGDSLYCISLYMPDQDGEAEYFIGDGMQRYNALVANGESETYAQVVLRWKSLNDAMEVGFSANMARFKMDESDVFSIMDTDLMNDRQIMQVADLKESTVARIRKVHEVGWLRKLVDKPNQALPYTRAAKLAAACGKDEDRFAALKIIMDEILETAEQNAAYYEQQGRSQKMTRKDAKKTTLKFWFDEQKDRLDSVATQLENGKIEKGDDDKFRVVEGATSGNIASVVGLAPEWEKRPAVSNFFDKEWSKLTLHDVEKVHRALPQINEYLEQQIKRMRPIEPMTSSTAKYVEKNESADSNPPKKQVPIAAPVNE